MTPSKAISMLQLIAAMRSVRRVSPQRLRGLFGRRSDIRKDIQEKGK